MGAVKLSVSLNEDAVRWLREMARGQHKSLSAVLNETVLQAKRDRALDEVLEWLDAPKLTRAEMEAITKRWDEGSPSTPAPSSPSSGDATPSRRRSARRGR